MISVVVAASDAIQFVGWKWISSAHVKEDLRRRRPGMAWPTVARMQGKTSALAAQLTGRDAANVLFQSDVKVRVSQANVLRLVQVVHEAEAEDVSPLSASRFVFRYHCVPATAQVAGIDMGSTAER